MHYVLCYPALDAAAAARIEAFRRAHEPERAALVRAHVTLVFGARSVAAAALVDQVAAAAMHVPPFAVSFAGTALHADPARGEFKLMLSAAEGAATLTALHRALHAGPLAAELRPDQPFSPHMTIATGTAPAAIDAALRASAALALPIRGRIEALDVATLEGRTLAAAARVALAG